MQTQLLTAILKSNTNQKKSLDEFIDEYLKGLNKSVKNNMSSFLSELIIYINKNFDIEKKLLISILDNKVKALSLNIPISSIEDFYEKSAKLSLESIASTLALSQVPTVVFNQVDIKAIKSLQDSFQFLKDDSSLKTQEKIKSIFTELFEGKFTRAETTQRLKDEFEHLYETTAHRLQAAADMIIRQNSSISSIIQAQKYGIEYFRIVSTIDNKTSPICKTMHNKIIPISHLIKQANKVMSANTIEEKKKAVDLSQGKNFKFSKELPDNIGFPPYHFGCRTTRTEVNMFDSTIDGKKIKYTTYPPNSNHYINSKKKKVEFSHIDKTNVERVVTDKTYAHGGRHHPISKKDTISALNSIEEIAPHIDGSPKTVAKSANGYILIFNGEELHTIFKPSQKTDKYFKINAIMKDKEIIKWKINFSSLFQTHGI